MAAAPDFRKPDRYKSSSYSSYDTKMPSRYDDCVWLRLCQVPRWDRAVVAALGPDLARLRILDVGCATGRLLARLAAAGATDLYGTDLAPGILDVAREKLAGLDVELQVADAEDVLPWDDCTFDAVTLTGVLHHFYRPRDALAEMRRVLRPGGRLLVIDPGFFPPLRQIFNLALRVKPHAGDCRFHSRGGAARLVGESGFEVTGNRRVGVWAYLVEGRAKQGGRLHV